MIRKASKFDLIKRLRTANNEAHHFPLLPLSSPPLLPATFPLCFLLGSHLWSFLSSVFRKHPDRPRRQRRRRRRRRRAESSFQTSSTTPISTSTTLSRVEANITFGRTRKVGRSGERHLHAAAASWNGSLKGENPITFPLYTNCMHLSPGEFLAWTAFLPAEVKKDEIADLMI